MWPIVDGRGVTVPTVGRTAVVPLTGHRPPLGEPPTFDPFDPQDVDVVTWDFSVIAYPGDAIVSVSVTSEPAVITIGTPVVFGAIVQAFVGPVTGSAETCDLNCAATFESGRVIDWGCEMNIASL